MKPAFTAAASAILAAGTALGSSAALAEIRGEGRVQTVTTRIGPTSQPSRFPVVASAQQTLVIIEREVERVPVWPLEPVTVIGIRPAPTPDPVIHEITKRGVVTRHVGGSGPRIITRDGDIIRSNAPADMPGGPRIIEVR